MKTVFMAVIEIRNGNPYVLVSAVRASAFHARLVQRRARGESASQKNWPNSHGQSD